MNYFITGTDTGAGKTYVTSLLLRSLRRSGLDSVGMKPICCGDRADAELLFEASGGAEPLDEINPVWLRSPLAPYQASLIEHTEVDLQRIRRSFRRLRDLHPSVLVEGVGGWLVPIKKGYLVSDLALELGLAVVVIVANRLGAINHTLLTVNAIRACGAKCAGVILNNIALKDDTATSTNRATLEDLLDVPILLEVSHGQQELPLGVA